MNQKVIIKITLPPEEILATKLLLCQVNGCGEQFSNASHLQMHLTRHHRLQSGGAVGLGNDSHVKHFHCPVESCLYHLNASGEKFFTSFRNLKQHFLKVHSVKNFICINCNGQKSFATESLLRAHQTNCGQLFICKICGYSYGSREALLTHTKRKNHGYEELLMSKNSKRKATEIPLDVPVKAVKGFAKSSIQVQTELPEDEICAADMAIKKSQTTQTDIDPPDLAAKIECSTQTATSSNQGSVESVNASTMDNFCQTNLEQFNYFEDSSLTCFGNVTVASNASSESVTCVCTETQTDLIYDEMFPNEDRTDPMLYSHMYTQTCDDIFSDLALSTIETQTSWGDGLGEFLVSTETQTNLMQSGSTECDAEGKISSIQTQTSASMEFLNAISSESSSIHTQTS
ncbi:zinc finger X-linked protein ZXDB [Ochlerotatus camptorhynchus]|uniref:zinc finger X-linked protein ZXDB n=1 Tax=Ochlerotatus camptorhynchus TaxID=644619 RepID=UPI0031DE8C8C